MSPTGLFAAGCFVGAVGVYAGSFWMSPEDYFARAKPKAMHLEMNTFSGEWEKVAVAYGYSDNYLACKELAEGLKMRAERKNLMVRDYRCVPTR